MNTITSRYRNSHRRRDLARARRLTTAPPNRYSAQLEALITLRRS